MVFVALCCFHGAVCVCVSGVGVHGVVVFFFFVDSVHGVLDGVSGVGVHGVLDGVMNATVVLLGVVRRSTKPLSHPSRHQKTTPRFQKHMFCF